MPYEGDPVNAANKEASPNNNTPLGPLGPLQPAETGKSGGVFISPDSLTFPTAAAVCAALVNSLGVFIGSAPRNVWIVMGASVLVGSIIIIVGWPARAGRKGTVVYAVTGILNILLLFASVIGLTAMATQSVPGLPG
jgi:hypothetical protein